MNLVCLIQEQIALNVLQGRMGIWGFALLVFKSQVAQMKWICPVNCFMYNRGCFVCFAK